MKLGIYQVSIVGDRGEGRERCSFYDLKTLGNSLESGEWEVDIELNETFPETDE